MMKEVKRLIKKANNLVNQVEEFVRSIEEENFGPSMIDDVR